MEPSKALGCPYCQGALTNSQEVGWPLACPACNHRFAVQGKIPVLLRQQDTERLARFSHLYREARLQEGRQPLTEDETLALPYAQPRSYPALYWQVRRQSFCALMQVLAREGPTPAHGPAADLGAGTGWLSYRLAQLGYRVLAVDANPDPDWGLGVAERHYLPRHPYWLALGDLENPPLQNGQLGLIVFNASLHYASDLEAAVFRAACALKRGGRLFILDTPVANQPRPGTGTGDRHLGCQELQRALEGAGLRPCWTSVRRGARWWLHQTKAWLRREPRFQFPLVVADPVQ
jgi:SAM-dependent methyltransferase